MSTTSQQETIVRLTIRLTHDGPLTDTLLNIACEGLAGETLIEGQVGYDEDTGKTIRVGTVVLDEVLEVAHR